jgi:hypothetical protein
MSPAMLVTILFFVIAIVSAILFPIVLRIKGPGRKDPVQRAWQKFLKRLARVGFESLPSDGAIELAAAASIRLPADSASIHEIAQIYTRSRYSAHPPPFSDLKQAIDKFRPNKNTA